MLQSRTQPFVTSASAIARDIKADMVAFMRDRLDGCTREDLLQEFTPRQIDQYGAAASREANRRSERRFA